MDQIKVLEGKLAEIEKRIRETEKRLPAHSVKQPVMMDLLALEDEYDALLEKIRKLREEIRSEDC